MAKIHQAIRRGPVTPSPSTQAALQRLQNAPATSPQGRLPECHPAIDRSHRV